MSLKVTHKDLVAIISKIYAAFLEKMDYLNDLDAKIGDGDHGLSMVTGLRAVDELVRSEPLLPIRQMLIRGGQQFNEAAGSTIGILIFSAMREAGNGIDEYKDSLGMADLAQMLDAAALGIMKRGKSQVGQKSILDSLVPASSAFSRIVQTGSMDEREAIQAVIDAARAGAESTREMVSSIGRAKWFSDRSLGIIDPGAMTGYLIIKAVGDYILGQGQNA